MLVPQFVHLRVGMTRNKVQETVESNLNVNLPLAIIATRRHPNPL
jgi:hypothetical protein